MEPGEQLLDAASLAQVRRKYLASEWRDFGAACRRTNLHARLLHNDGADAGHDLTLGQEAIADDRLAALGVAHIPVRSQVGLDLGLEGGGQKAPCAVRRGG